ncbi:MAG: winged helix-turn-helix transcriptional regulator [Azospirillum sp.]|nr:winged helix-turn-helix transcriptional regulator [Azospirillum sp.]
MIELDAIDRKILAALQRDGRMTNAELAQQINLSASACLRRVRRLEDDGVIDGYVMLVNQTAIGRSASVFVEITLDSQSDDNLDRFEAAVAACPDVMECYLMAGEFDYLVRVAARDTGDFERIHRSVLTSLPGVARTRSCFVMRPVCKKTSFEV